MSWLLSFFLCSSLPWLQTRLVHDQLELETTYLPRAPSRAGATNSRRSGIGRMMEAEFFSFLFFAHLCGQHWFWNHIIHGLHWDNDDQKVCIGYVLHRAMSWRACWLLSLLSFHQLNVAFLPPFPFLFWHFWELLTPISIFVTNHLELSTTICSKVLHNDLDK